MKVYTCTVCGWVYDEAAGDPDNGIAPGTKWEDLPDDFVCPLCGVGEGARMALAQMGVAIYAGVRGSADEAVRALLAGTLQATATATCDHHGHEHGHDCGSHHDCSGNHGCGGHEGGCH